MARDLNPLNAVVRKLLSIHGVTDVWRVGVAERRTILRLEEKASESAVYAGLMIVNEGARQALQREFVISINHSRNLRHPSKPILVLRADKDIVGHEVWEDDQLTKFQADPNAILLGKGFVLFRDKLENAVGRPMRFVFEPQSFPEIETNQNVYDVVSATVSPTTDLYIKGRAGWDTTDFDKGTVLIGFNSSPRKRSNLFQSGLS